MPGKWRIIVARQMGFMQRTALAGFLLMSVLLTSCGFYDHRARILLCKEIAATNDSLYTMTRAWHMLLDKAVLTKNFALLHENRIRLGQYISRKRSDIANLELPADAETLRQSEDVFLSNQTTVISEIYPQFEAYNSLTPAEDIQRSLRAVAGDEDNVLAWKLTIKKSLDAFIKKHGLKIPK